MDGFDVAEKLIGASASLNLFSKAGFTPLSMASGSGNGPVVALLLKNGADPNALHEEGSTALMYAAALGHHDVVALLVQAGADARLKESLASGGLKCEVTAEDSKILARTLAKAIKTTGKSMVTIRKLQSGSGID